MPLGFGFGGACFRDEVADLARKRRDVIRNAAGYRPLYAAGLYRFTVADLFRAGRVKDFEIGERVAVHDDQVRLIADADTPDRVFLAEYLRTVARRVLNDL